ncbi:hypothetical protein [Carboxydocella sp. JDF658]|uniref:hypothetical protein n=1 Tax=Carboxydocella sp. JDF658 TaxID=1926600 RepID=UPI0009AEB4B2|nr:hypothetical protein [Carboxydocella sp. JDF658]GAW30660.1 hypothetical protein JDF658_04250 [Carboxydocella sp. JDF658]
MIKITLEKALQEYKRLNYARDEYRILHKYFLQQEIAMDVDLKANLEKLLIKCADGIGSYTRDKGKLTRILNHFFNFVSQKYQLDIEPEDYFPVFKTLEKSERMVALLKYLQEKPRTRKEIAEHFHITERALRDNLQELQSGFTFLGYTMKIKVDPRTNTYDSTIHPVFLPLNLSEVYALTVGLKLMGRDSVFGDIFYYIADSIFQQLSSYARQRIAGKANEVGISFNEIPALVYRAEDEIIASGRDQLLAYFLKSGAPCKIEYNTEAGIQTITGKVNYVKSGRNYLTHRIIVQNEKKQVEIDYDQILSIQFTRSEN